jgi:hypothetical protein
MTATPVKKGKPPVLLFAALGLSLAVAGIVRPWDRRRTPPAEEPTPMIDPDLAGETAPRARPATDEELALFARALTRRDDAAESKPAAVRDPFFLPEEAIAGRSLAALWREEDERRAASSRPIAPPTVARAAPTESDQERIRGLKLLGIVGGPDQGAAVFEEVGRVRVGDCVPGSPFRLTAVSAAGVRFRADDLEIELPRRGPQGGTVRSENK